MAEQSKELDDIERAIRLNEITLTVGRHILHLIWSLIGISVALAVYDFSTNNIVWGIISSLFALGGFFSWRRFISTAAGIVPADRQGLQKRGRNTKKSLLPSATIEPSGLDFCCSGFAFSASWH